MTKVLYDGEWVETPKNPGEEVSSVSINVHQETRSMGFDTFMYLGSLAKQFGYCLGKCELQYLKGSYFPLITKAN